MTVPRSEWRSESLCARPEHDPDLWFEKPRLAKELCRGCPVVEACLGWALTLSDLDGVAGGLTERERRVIRGGRRRRGESTGGRTSPDGTPKKEKAA